MVGLPPQSVKKEVHDKVHQEHTNYAGTRTRPLVGQMVGR